MYTGLAGDDVWRNDLSTRLDGIFKKWEHKYKKIETEIDNRGGKLIRYLWKLTVSNNFEMLD